MPEQLIRPLVIFLPEVGIEPYVRTLAILADAGRVPKQRVLLTKCTGQMEYCSMMAMHGISVSDVKKNKKRLCAICNEKHSEVCSVYGFESLELSHVALPIDKVVQVVEEQVHSLGSVEFDGFFVGKVAAIEFSLLTKRSYGESVSPENDFLMRSLVVNVMIAQEYSKKIIQRENPSSVLFFNDYPACQAMRFYAKKYHVNCVVSSLPVHLGICGSLFFCSNILLDSYILNHLSKYPEKLHLSVEKKSVYACFDDVLFRSYGENSHLFSPNKNSSLDILCKKLGIDVSKKICVAYTSSLDERYALDTTLKMWKVHLGKADAFDSQIEWLQALRSFVSARSDMQVVVRIHPREGTKKRKGVAEHLMHLQKEFSEQVRNFVVVWPDDPISSYDLMELADIVLVGWSTMGAEAFRVGVPVLSWSGNMYYSDSDCVRVATTKEKYFAVLEDILRKDPTFEQLREGVRYYHWRTFIPCIDMSETVDSYPYRSSYWPKAPESCKNVIRDILQNAADGPVDYAVAQWKSALNEHSQDNERRAIIDGICALIEVTFFPPKRIPVPFWFKVMRKCVRILTKRSLVWKECAIPQVKDFIQLQLECLSGVCDDGYLRKRTHDNKNLRVLVINGDVSMYYRNGMCVQRTSKLISRLGKYVAEFGFCASSRSDFVQTSAFQGELD